jgi:hypothetical protein
MLAMSVCTAARSGQGNTWTENFARSFAFGSASL